MDKSIDYSQLVVMQVITVYIKTHPA